MSADVAGKAVQIEENQGGVGKVVGLSPLETIEVGGDIWSVMSKRVDTLKGFGDLSLVAWWLCTQFPCGGFRACAALPRHMQFVSISVVGRSLKNFVKNLLLLEPCLFETLHILFDNLVFCARGNRCARKKVLKTSFWIKFETERIQSAIHVKTPVTFYTFTLL